MPMNTKGIGASRVWAAQQYMTERALDANFYPNGLPWGGALGR